MAGAEDFLHHTNHGAEGGGGERRLWEARLAHNGSPKHKKLMALMLARWRLRVVAFVRGSDTALRPIQRMFAA